MLTQPNISGQQLLFDRALLEILDEDILGDQEIWNLLWKMGPPNKGIDPSRTSHSGWITSRGPHGPFDLSSSQDLIFLL